jgi:DNA-damage-inducible protein D
MNKIKNAKKYNEKIFEKIKHIDEYGNEYWEARELQGILGYKQWRSLEELISRAKIACQNSGNSVSDYFAVDRKIVKTGIATKEIVDYKLSRYACYLIVQNGNPRKEVIALGQTYFAMQTRKQEINEKEYEILSEIEKRFYNRNLTREGNYQLNQVAKNAGVKKFDRFHNAGYKGLYDGETADDIFKRKKLRYREDILDNMGSDELATNIFRISQTKQKIENEKIVGEDNAQKAHYEIGKNVRDVICKNGGTMPEKLPTPKKSLKELKNNKKLGSNNRK